MAAHKRLNRNETHDNRRSFLKSIILKFKFWKYTKYNHNVIMNKTSHHIIYRL